MVTNAEFFALSPVDRILWSAGNDFCLYQPHTSEWCGSGGDSGHQGEWRWWPKANDAPSYSKDDLLNGSADVLAQSLPYVRREFISVLRYEIEPGVYDGGFASTLGSLVQDVVFDLAVEARVHTQSKFSRYLSPRRYVEVISAPLDALFISDLFAAEGAALRAAASAEDDRTFFRLITLWSAYMHKLGSSTLVYHTLRHLDAMALAASAGLRDEVSKHQQSVLCTASRARHDYRDVNNGVTDQEIYDSCTEPLPLPELHANLVTREMIMEKDEGRTPQGGTSVKQAPLVKEDL